MNKRVDIHCRVEGDDPGIATLHTDLGCALERGWTQPFRKGVPMSDGSPSPTHFTSLVVAEDVLDHPAAREANPAIIAWLEKNHDAIARRHPACCLIQVCIYLRPNDAYEGFYFDHRTIALAAERHYGLEVMAYRLLENAVTPGA